jgi:tRNA threonylcarbamoyladenosine biosynthesis protein TsaE
MLPTYAITTACDTATVATGCALAPLVIPGDVIVLSGDLGAGKTQLAKGLAAGLGVVEPVTSPTFNILLVHEGRIPLFHFDLYRLDAADELEDIDYWGTLEADGVSVVEWGDRFAEAVPQECVVVRIHIEGDEDRLLEVEPRGVRGGALARDWAAACATLDGVTVTGPSERS